jgi:hypothetical protein
MNTIEPQNAKFVAEVRDVKELRLIGSVKLDFWNKQLKDKPFQAFQTAGGCAEITIAATELVWKGFRFNELTISLAIAARDDARKHTGYLLLHALNSNRFFAFCERTFFSTPYHFGKVNLRETTPCLINAQSNNQNVLKAAMSRTTRPVTEENESWEGAIFLPNARSEKYFIGKLSGKTKICPFIETDRIEMQSDTKNIVFDLLIASDFKGKEWRMRSQAFHAKSKTYCVALQR